MSLLVVLLLSVTLLFRVLFYGCLCNWIRIALNSGTVDKYAGMRKKLKEREVVVLRHFVAIFQEKLNKFTKYSTRVANVSTESRTELLPLPLNQNAWFIAL
jgi:hypothetical protein